MFSRRSPLHSRWRYLLFLTSFHSLSSAMNFAVCMLLLTTTEGSSAPETLTNTTDNINQNNNSSSNLLKNWQTICDIGLRCPVSDDQHQHHHSSDTVPYAILEPANSADIECRRAIERYAVYAANFTYCTVKFARPITFCEQCIEYHDRAENEMLLLKSLTKPYNPTTNDTAALRTCHDIMTNSDRIHLLEQSDQFLTSVWAESNCNYCFNNHSVDRTTGQFTYAYSSDLNEFQRRHTETLECFRQYATEYIIRNDTPSHPNRSAACSQCSDEYDSLNTLYTDLERNVDASGGVGLCMDMVDLMNYTRQTWSNVFQCKSQPISDPALYAVTLFLALFTLTFYVSSKIQTEFEWFTVRKQRRLTQQQIEENAAAASAAAATAAPSRFQHHQYYRNNSDPRYCQPPTSQQRQQQPAGFDVFSHSYDALGLSSYAASDSDMLTSASYNQFGYNNNNQQQQQQHANIGGGGGGSNYNNNSSSLNDDYFGGGGMTTAAVTPSNRMPPSTNTRRSSDAL